MTPGRINEKIVAGKVAIVEEMLRGIASLPLDGEVAFRADPRMVAAGESYLRRALEALIDLGRHVLARGFGIAVPEYAKVADELCRAGVLDAPTATTLAQMARYRNRLVHFYDEIGPPKLFGILSLRRGDITAALDALRNWLTAHPDLLDTSL